MKKIILPMAVSVVVLGGCTSTPVKNSDPLPELTFKHMQTIPVNVNDIHYTGRIDRGAAVWDIANELPTPPDVAMRRYLAQRFKENGHDGELVVSLEKAQITTREEPNENRFLAYIPLANTSEYIFEIVVGLERKYLAGLANAATSTRFIRKVQMPLNVTIAYREATLQRTLEEMMRDIDETLVRTLAMDFNLIATKDIPVKNLDVNTSVPETRTRIGVFMKDMQEKAEKAGDDLSGALSGDKTPTAPPTDGQAVSAPQPLAPVKTEPLMD